MSPATNLFLSWLDATFPNESEIDYCLKQYLYEVQTPDGGRLDLKGRTGSCSRRRRGIAGRIASARFYTPLEERPNALDGGGRGDGNRSNRASARIAPRCYNFFLFNGLGGFRIPGHYPLLKRIDLCFNKPRRY